MRNSWEVILEGTLKRTKLPPLAAVWPKNEHKSVLSSSALTSQFSFFFYLAPFRAKFCKTLGFFAYFFPSSSCKKTGFAGVGLRLICVQKCVRPGRVALALCKRRVAVCPCVAYLYFPPVGRGAPARTVYAYLSLLSLFWHHVYNYGKEGETGGREEETEDKISICRERAGQGGRRGITTSGGERRDAGEVKQVFLFLLCKRLYNTHSGKKNECQSGLQKRRGKKGCTKLGGTEFCRRIGTILDGWNRCFLFPN